MTRTRWVYLDLPPDGTVVSSICRQRRRQNQADLQRLFSLLRKGYVLHAARLVFFFFLSSTKAFDHSAEVIFASHPAHGVTALAPWPHLAAHPNKRGSMFMRACVGQKAQLYMFLKGEPSGICTCVSGHVQLFVRQDRGNFTFSSVSSSAPSPVEAL